MNYLDYFRDGGETQIFPIPDTIQSKNYIIKRKPGEIINYSFFSKNNLKYVGDKLGKASNALDIKMDAFDNFISSFGKSLDAAFGINCGYNSQRVDYNRSVNQFTYNQPGS